MVHPHDVRTEERPCHISTSNGDYLCARKVAACFAIHRRSHHIFRDLAGAFDSCRVRPTVDKLSGNDVEVKEVFLLFRRNRLSRAYNNATTFTYCHQDHRCRTQLEIPNDNVRATLLSEVMQCISPIRRKFLTSGRPLEQTSEERRTDDIRAQQR